MPMPTGLTFRSPDETCDCAEIARVMNESWSADGVEWTISEEELRGDFEDRNASCPQEDWLLVEIEGKLVGVVTSSRGPESDGVRIFRHYSHLVKDARKKGVRRAMLRWAEEHLAELAASVPEGAKCECESWANVEPNDWRATLLDAGYSSRRHLFEMRRDTSGELPASGLPVGIQIRQVKQEHLPLIWKAMSEALADDPDCDQEAYGENAFVPWRDSPGRRFDLWVVAWDGSEVVGGAGVDIKEEENRSLGRKRAWIEPIFVRRPWRRKGIAHAMIARAIRAAAEEGMEECGLDVNTNNPSRASVLYESVGFRKTYELAFYWKPLERPTKGQS